MAANKHKQIRRRAYEIWESEGRPEGADLRHWQQACDELRRNDDHETPQVLLNEVDRDETAMLQGAGESGDADRGRESPRDRKRLKNLEPAAQEVEITTGEQPARQTIKKTEGP